MRSKVAAIERNADLYPVSAQCRILGVARTTYYRLLKKLHDDKSDTYCDPIGDAVEEVFKQSKARYGTRRIKCVLEKSKGITLSRRKISNIMKERGLLSCHTKKKFRAQIQKVNQAEVPNILDRNFNGYMPHTHIVSDLTYVRVGNTWCYICLLIDLYNREIVGHAASSKKNAALIKAAFATVTFPLFEIDVFHTDRGSEFDNQQIDEMLSVFNITRSLSKKGCPYDNAVDESTNKTLKIEFIWQNQFSNLHDLQIRLSDYVWWYNNERIHSTLGYMSPVEFREQKLSL